MEVISKGSIMGTRDYRVAIIGVGVVGTVLGVVLNRCGYPIAGVADCSEGRARRAAQRIDGAASSTDVVEIAKSSTCIFITTPDDVIAETCAAIVGGGGISEGDVVFHCSGALSADVLDSARRCGAFGASMHPMGVFADVDVALDHLSDLFFCLEGDAEAVQLGERIVKDIGATPVRLPKELKTMTHIAACLVSNYMMTLADVALGLIRDLGLSKQERLKLLLPLVQGAVRALEEQGLPEALTGPIARGDVSTVKRHLEAIRSDTALTRLYALLGLRTIPVAREKGTVEERKLVTLEGIVRECFENAKDNDTTFSKWR